MSEPMRFLYRFALLFVICTLAYYGGKYVFHVAFGWKAQSWIEALLFGSGMGLAFTLWPGKRRSPQP